MGRVGQKQDSGSPPKHSEACPLMDWQWAWFRCYFADPAQRFPSTDAPCLSIFLGSVGLLTPVLTALARIPLQQQSAHMTQLEYRMAEGTATEALRD